MLPLFRPPWSRTSAKRRDSARKKMRRQCTSQTGLGRTHSESGSKFPHCKNKAPRSGRDAQGLFQMVFKLRLDRHRRRFWPRRSAAHFSDLEPHEAPDRDVFAQFGDRLGNHLADRHALVLDVVLFVQAILLVELFHLPPDVLFDDWLLLSRPQSLRLVDITFLFEHL